MKRELELEQYFTPNKTVKQLMKEVNKRYNLKDFENIIEPSAGAGAFLKELPERAIGLDLEPKHDKVIKQDFFTYKFPKGKNIVIGNPPYGRRASLAIKFLNKSAENADVMAFVLPRSYVRAAIQNTVNEYFHLVFEKRTSEFEMPNGDTYNVKSVMQIWERRDYKREKMIEPKFHKDFELTHQHMSWATEDEKDELRNNNPIFIGQNSMKVKTSDEAVKGSAWFIKPKSQKVIDRFNRADFTVVLEDTTGAPSLSKGDIINIYNKTK